MSESGKEGKREMEEKDAKRGREEERIRELRLLFFSFCFCFASRGSKCDFFCFLECWKVEKKGKEKWMREKRREK